jgi:translation initiation factor 3 subunit L
MYLHIHSQYYQSSPWPSPQTIASECNGHPLFLALYRELTHRHWHAVSRPTIRDRIDGWHVYRELFDEILLDAEESGDDGTANFYILPLWAFDVLHEFVYQFQGFCQFRATLHAAATKHGVIVSNDSNNSATQQPATPGTPTTTTSSGKAPPHHVTENISILSQNTDAWAAETVVFYLRRLIDIGASPKCSIPAYQYLGLFASVVLSRLECLLGDYRASLAALTFVTKTSIAVTKDDETKSALEVVNSVYPARLSLAYHGGLAFLMLRRYKDASHLLGSICANMHRGFKVRQHVKSLLITH